MLDGLVPRVIATVCLGAAVVTVALVVLTSHHDYRIEARFVDAGQLVTGDLVEVAGRPVGKVDGIRLTRGGQAGVDLKITDDAVAPLHEGTTATVRTVGLSAIANRFVELEPGPAEAPRIGDGGVLPSSQTRGIVDLDTLLDSVTPSVRADIRTIIRQAARTVTPRAARQFNAGIPYLNPALGQTEALGQEVVLDQAALERLVHEGATVSHALAARSDDLGAGVGSLAGALRQVAERRRTLGDALGRAPAVLGQTRSTLAHLDRTLPTVDPVLRGLRPAIAPLGELLRRTPPIARNAQPAIASIRRLLPQARTALARIPPLERKASPALSSLTVALKDLLPIVAGLRAYSPDLVGGFFNGFGGAAGGTYDANGHYIRISLQGATSSLVGLLNPTSVLPKTGYRTGLDARCPGGAEEPAPDRSNPWVPPDVPNLCDPGDDHR